jgi:hypothetical protein
MSHNVNLDYLERDVLEQVESYRYEVLDSALGNPMPQDWVLQQLAQLRAALVKPEWRLVTNKDMPQAGETPEVRQCALVAHDPDGVELYYDPIDEEFVLACGDPPETFGIRGDVVGCYMAR